jgi:peptidoglycan/xylan/chitin deacetylase (PgdA/CDA1 family)
MFTCGAIPVVEEAVRAAHLAALLVFVLSGCMPAAQAGVAGATPPIVEVEPTPSPIPTLPVPSWTLLPTLTPWNTPIPTVTLSPLPTSTPAPSLTPTWVWASPGVVTAPILLYHHIAESGVTSRYYISPQNFRAQMEALRAWGYTTITPTHLVNVILGGGLLPARPVIITFDDGNLDVYENAFPIMQEMGFVGAVYIVSNRLGAEDFLSGEQLAELAAAGWEIGSHGRSHVNLAANHAMAREEILQSRLDIGTAAGVTVTTIAYPFGMVDDYVFEKTEEYGYVAGLGLGVLWDHSLGTLYYLNRREVHAEYNLAAFAALLPWSGAVTDPQP